MKAAPPTKNKNDNTSNTQKVEGERGTPPEGTKSLQHHPRKENNTTPNKNGNATPTKAAPPRKGRGRKAAPPTTRRATHNFTFHLLQFTASVTEFDLVLFSYIISIFFGCQINKQRLKATPLGKHRTPKAEEAGKHHLPTLVEERKHLHTQTEEEGKTTTVEEEKGGKHCHPNGRGGKTPPSYTGSREKTPPPKTKEEGKHHHSKQWTTSLSFASLCFTATCFNSFAPLSCLE